MRLRRTRMLAVAALLALVLAGCARGGQAPAGTGQPSGGQAETPTLLIGAALPITGDLAPQGREVRDGYTFWMETVNAKGGLNIGGKKYKVEIKFYDYASDVNQAVKLVDKLITQDGVKFILGPYSSAHIIAVAPVAEKYGVLHINSTGSSREIYNKGYKYTFGLLPPSTEFARAILELWAAQNPKPRTLAILARSDLFPKSVAKDAENLAKQLGIEVIYYGEYPPGTTDLTQALTEIKNRNPDLVFFTGYANDSILALRTRKQIGLNPKAWGATAGLTAPDFLEAMKENAWDVTTSESWISVLPDNVRDDLFGSAKEYAEKFQQRFGYRASYIQAASSAAGLILGKCLEEVGVIDPAKVRDCVAKWDRMTFYGHVKFDPGGQNMGRAFAVQIKYPKMEVVWPKEFATAPYSYPAQWK